MMQFPSGMTHNYNHDHEQGSPEPKSSQLSLECYQLVDYYYLQCIRQRQIKVEVFLTVMSAGQPCGFQGHRNLPLKFQKKSP